MPEVQDETQPVALLKAYRDVAEFERDNWGQQSEFARVESQARMDTLDWLMGVTLLAPATEESVAATEYDAV